MEWKTIIYILLGIGWLVYTNYKKIVAENNKRNLNLPPSDATGEKARPLPPQKPVGEIPSSEKKPRPPVLRSPRVNPVSKQESKRVFRKNEKNPRHIPDPFTIEQSREFETLTPERKSITDSATVSEILQTELPGRELSKKSFQPDKSKKQLRNAFVLGEVLTRPRFEFAYGM